MKSIHQSKVYVVIFTVNRSVPEEEEEERQDQQTTDDFITRVLEKIKWKIERLVYRRENKSTWNQISVYEGV